MRSSADLPASSDADGDASLLLYSPKALRRIKAFCVGKPAYIVPAVVGPEELHGPG